MHWSYDYSDPDPLYGQAFLKEFPYSLDANRYRPMCRSCHKNHDNCRRPPALPPEYGEYEEHHKLYFNNAEHGDAPSADALGRLAHLLSVRQ